MKTTQQETLIIKKIARLVRGTRKLLGHSQDDIAKRLGLIQSALSRIETGSQMLSAPQWVEFCHFTGISPDSIMTGHVDFKIRATLKEDDREGTFKIPRRYSKERGSKVRAMLPFLSYFESLYGEDALRKYLKSVKIDPDFFICLDNQVSLNFCLDIAEHLVHKGALKPKDFSKLTKPIATPSMHGRVHDLYEDKSNPADLIDTLISNSTYYECNFNYKIEHQTRGHLDLSITPAEHLEAMQYRNHPVLGDFLCRYKKHYFERFSTMGGKGGSTVDELECHYKGHSKCVYRVSPAN